LGKCQIEVGIVERAVAVEIAVGPSRIRRGVVASIRRSSRVSKRNAFLQLSAVRDFDTWCLNNFHMVMPCKKEMENNHDEWRLTKRIRRLTLITAKNMTIEQLGSGTER
jgi:hypothetical protein